jgi:hypothetical protein
MLWEQAMLMLKRALHGIAITGTSLIMVLILHWQGLPGFNFLLTLCRWMSQLPSKMICVTHALCRGGWILAVVSYEKLQRFKNINVPIKPCVQMVMDMNQFDPQQLPHLGTDRDGKALSIMTSALFQQARHAEQQEHERRQARRQAEQQQEALFQQQQWEARLQAERLQQQEVEARHAEQQEHERRQAQQQRQRQEAQHPRKAEQEERARGDAGRKRHTGSWSDGRAGEYFGWTCCRSRNKKSTYCFHAEQRLQQQEVEARHAEQQEHERRQAQQQRQRQEAQRKAEQEERARGDAGRKRHTGSWSDGNWRGEWRWTCCRSQNKKSTYCFCDYLGNPVVTRGSD